jgi:hypothetical protein
LSRDYRTLATEVYEPTSPPAFVDYRRLRVGAYRVMYVVEDDIITIERVDLVL